MEATIIERTVAANSVVQNDAAATASITTQVAATGLVALEERRMLWETTIYRTSNQQLYALLAECYAFAGELPLEQSKQRSKVLADFCQSRGYVVKKETPLLTRVVKAVFGNVDRRRISTYSVVLRTAKAANVLPTNLAQWIEDNSGVQEIKLARSATYVSPSAKVGMAKQSFDTLPELATVKSEALSQLADSDFMGDCCLLIAEQNAEGAFVVRGFTRAGGAVTAAFAALYAEQKKAA